MSAGDRFTRAVRNSCWSFCVHLISCSPVCHDTAGSEEGWTCFPIDALRYRLKGPRL